MKRKRNSIMQAVKDGDMSSLLTLLEKGADANENDPEGTTVLMAAVSGGHTDIVKVLIEKGADVNVRNNARFTAPAMAVSAPL